MKHYTEDGLYDGPKHKMDDGTSHTGKTHTKTSKPISHNKKGPFKMKSPLYGKPGLWDAINAKRKRIKAGSGETMRSSGDPKRPTNQDFKDSQ